MKRMGTLWGALWMLALGVCLLLAPGAARAQLGEETPALAQDWSLRLGLWVPNSQSVRSATSDVGLSALVERRIYRGQSWDLYAGIGYNGWGDVYSVPILVNGIARYNDVRYGIGAGWSFGQSLEGSTNGAVLDLILGYQLTHGKNPLSADVRYYFVSGSSNEMDGWSFTVGMQF